MSSSHTQCLRGHSSGDLVFLCWDKRCVPVLWAAQEAPGRMLKTSEGSQRKALGGSEGPECHPLPQPHHPLALWLGCHMEPSYLTLLQRILFQHHPHNLHTLIFLPILAKHPGLLTPLLQLRTFAKLAVRTAKKQPYQSPRQGAALSLLLVISLFPLQLTVPRKPQSQDMHQTPISFLEKSAHALGSAGHLVADA